MTHAAPTARKTFVVLAVALSITTTLIMLAARPAAAASGKIPVAYFKVAVKGVQRTTQTFHHKPENQCDVTDNSTITEKIVFKSAPKIALVSDFSGQVNPSLLAFPDAGSFKAPATVTRRYTPSVIVPPAGPECGESDGTGEEAELKPDCGTKRVPDFSVDLEFDERRPGGLRLLAHEHEDPFNNCTAPLGELGFPYLLLEDTQGKDILGELPKGELLDTGIGKIIVLGGGTQKLEEPDVSVKTSIEWDVSFTRIAKPK